MTKDKIEKYRIGAYVNRETWEKIVDIQGQVKAQTGKKPSQGEVLDKIVKDSRV